MIKISKKEILNNGNGITLLALVVTIVILIILASISIATLTGNNGIINKAESTKESAEVQTEKEIIELATIQAMRNDRKGNLLQDKFQESLDSNSTEENKAHIIDFSGDIYTVKFDSNRYYEVDADGKIEYIASTNGEKELTIQCVDSKGNIIQEYKYTVVKNNYSRKCPSLDGYEPAEEKYEGEITESKTIQVLYYLLLQDDTTLIFTGLNGSGNITTNENEIVSYMIGTDTGQGGGPNGLIDKNNADIKSIVRIPETYKGKPVVKIGEWSLGKLGGTQMMKFELPENLTTIGKNGLYKNKATEITFGKNMVNFGEGLCDTDTITKIVFENKKSMYGYSAFFGLPNWTTIEVGKDNTYYYLEDNVLYSSDKKNLIKVAAGREGTFVIPDFVENIQEGLASCQKITEIIMNDTITSIPAHGFRGCRGLETLTIGASVTRIGDNAFYAVNGLKTVIINSATIAGGITTQTSFNSVVNSAETIYIKDNITNIGSYITNNFTTTTSDKPGYSKYVINT